MKYIFAGLGFLFIITVKAQQPDYSKMTEAIFNENIVGGGWHPESESNLLFGNIFTVKIEGHHYNTQMMKIDGTFDMYLEGVNSTDNSTFKYTGTCNVRFENKYFELELIGTNLQKITTYIGGYLVNDHQMHIACSKTPFLFNDDFLEQVKWYTSRR